MSSLFSEIEPYNTGFLRVDKSDTIYWECCGNPLGKPALVVHGGPGSGVTPWWRRLFNPEKYNIILFDQRGCGRSFPLASDSTTSLENNTTSNLINDIEKLRIHLGINHWLVLGGSWGSTLSLAYAEQFPDRILGLILFGVTTGRREEFNWTFKGGLSVFFPQQWDNLVKGIIPGLDPSDVVASYYIMLNNPSKVIRNKAALNWCLWESATPDWPPNSGLFTRFKDPDFAYGFSRLVTHYVSHNAWLEDNILIKNSNILDKVPIVLINGRFDFQAPLGNAWLLKKYLPQAKLIIVDNAGHLASTSIENEIIKATNLFIES